jgi:hypothetical protein
VLGCNSFGWPSWFDVWLDKLENGIISLEGIYTAASRSSLVSFCETYLFILMAGKATEL